MIGKIKRFINSYVNPKVFEFMMQCLAIFLIQVGSICTAVYLLKYLGAI